MKKARWISIAAAGVMAMSLGACGSSGGDTESVSNSAGSTSKDVSAASDTSSVSTTSLSEGGGKMQRISILCM